MTTFRDALLVGATTVNPLELFPGLPTLDETYGALMIGSFVGFILYGAVLHQAYRYIRLYGNDQLVNKLLVLGLVVIDTVHAIACLHVCHSYLVANYFRPLALLRGVWSLSIQPLLAGFALLLAQTFFARRVYIISPRHRTLVAVSILLTFTAFGFAIAGTVIAFKFHMFTQYEHYYWIDSAACGCAVVADSLTTSVLIVALRRSRTGFKQTDTILNRLVLYAINTGLLTGIANSLALIFALARPNSFIWIGVEIIAIRLYTNSVLAVLNSRRSLREIDDSEHFELESTSHAARALSVPQFRNVPQAAKTASQRLHGSGRAWDSADSVIDNAGGQHQYLAA